MAEPIKIGGQTFIKNEKGWIDQKTKVKAPEGLITLLDKVSEEQSPAGMKKRAILDNNFIVKLGDSEYIWDMNNQIFVDKKTKNPVPKHLSSIIEAAAGMKKASAEDRNKVSAGVINNMGSTGQAAKQKVRTPSGSGRLPAPNMKINSPVIHMIEKLATIDGYLKQRLDNQKKIANRNLVAFKEAAIEAKSEDASPVEQTSENDAEKSDATGMGVALLAGGLIAAQFEPVQEAFKSLAGGIKNIFNFVENVAKTVADGLDFFTGGSSSASSVETSTAIPNITQGNTPSSPNIAAPAELSIPSEANRAVPSATTPSSVAPTTPAIVPNSGYTKPAMTTSSRSSSRVNASSVASNNSGSRASTPSATPMSPMTSAAPAMTPTPNATPASAAPSTPNATPNGSNYDGLKLKSEETTGGGQAASKTIEFAKIVQAQIPELTRFTAFNDNYHKGRTSKHNEGLAFDFTIKDPSQSTAVVDRVKAAADASGYKVKIIDEYKDPSGHATGGHIHVTVLGPGTGSTIEGGSSSSMLERFATAGVDLTRGVMESIGTILRAGLGDMKVTSGSQLSTVNDTMSGNIARAARDRAATVAATKTAKPVAVTKSDPVNMSASSGSSTIQNMPTVSDKAAVEFYLTRMGFPKITYTQTSR